MKFRLLAAAISIACAFAQTTPDLVTARQGENMTPLTDVALRVVFVRSDGEDPKSAIANKLITEVGLNLLSMGMGTQMLMWNPYMGQAFTQFASIGKGFFGGKSSEVKGFEYEMLSGITASATLKAEQAEFLVPLNPFRPSADFAADEVHPVLLRLESRPEDQVRMMTSRSVSIKQEKKGRFDMKPKSEREEKGIQERVVLTEVARLPGDAIRIATVGALEPGEYALVLRSKGANGVATRNVALKPVTPLSGTDSMSEPPAAPRGMLGMLNTSQPPPAEKPAMAGFLAWDFRVMP